MLPAPPARPAPSTPPAVPDAPARDRPGCPTTYLYSSSDAGAHWARFAVLGLFDGAAAIEQTPDGTVLVEGIYDGVELSRDGGRTWAKPATVDESLPVQGGGPLAAALVTSEDGYVLAGDQGPLWVTRDGGRTWSQVPVR